MDQRDITRTLVGAIADVEGVQPHQLEYSLYEHVDTEALRRLTLMEATTWELTFDIPDHEVMVAGDGRIRIDGELVREANDAPFQETS